MHIEKHLSKCFYVNKQTVSYKNPGFHEGKEMPIKIQVIISF